jgi:hypothetical protein
MPSKSEVTYTVGQGAAAHRTLGVRTAESCAAYLLLYLKSTSLKLLDVRCGLGSITADFAQILTAGHVTGIDQGTEAVEADRGGRQHLLRSWRCHCTALPGQHIRCRTCPSRPVSTPRSNRCLPRNEASGEAWRAGCVPRSNQ